MEEKKISNIDQLQSKELLKEVILQLNKDFKSSGIPIDIPLKIESHQLLDLIKKIIDKIYQSPFADKIDVLLYRIDVPETLINQLMEDSSGVTYTDSISFLILRREIQKVLYRKSEQEKEA